ncbi:hypothetical protein Patl1_36941 [Pistacia atlantica]|nr:hypothetical protein Patl1_36941 [Pistacia atlantica]
MANRGSYASGPRLVITKQCFQHIFSNYKWKPSIDGCGQLKFPKFFGIIRSFRFHLSLQTGLQV